MQNILIKKQGESKERGFIALVTVLAVSAVALLIGAGILLQSVTEGQISSNEEQTAKAWATVSGCVEIALKNIATTTASSTYIWNTSYNTAPTSPLTIAGNTCYIYQINATTTPAADARVINASSTVSGFTRKMQVIVATSTASTTAPAVYSWQEVGDF